MGLFRKKAPSPRNNAIWLYVQCDNCGEKIRIRIDPEHDLQPDYEGSGFLLRKEMMDGHCFRLMYGEVHLDRDYRILSQEISGGHFITREEFEG